MSRSPEARPAPVGPPDHDVPPDPAAPGAGGRPARRRRALLAGVAALAVAVLVVTLLVADRDGGPDGAGPDTALLDLPRVPWEGGPEYWARFPATADAGWTDPAFFPVVSWFNGISSDEEVRYDRSLGFNTYIGMDPSTPYSLFADNDVYWIGGALNETFTEDSRNWVGTFLDDEVDGRFPPDEARDRLAQLRESAPADRPAYANFTQTVVSRDMTDDDAEALINDYTDVVSVDMYWYTIPFCDWDPYRAVYLLPVEQETCRTASSYGTVVEMLRQRDAADGELQATWQFVEVLNGGPGEGPFLGNIEPDQLRGAVMSSLIHEARGIVYFNQSLSGPCQGGNVIRLSQVQEDFCGAAQVAAAGEVNAQIHELAPVLNTQSYEHDAGPGLDTMLKAHDGYAYLFAMVDGSGPPGERRLDLPAGLAGGEAEVLFEDRTVPVVDGRITDTFTTESTYHVYRIPLEGTGEPA